VYFLTSLKAAGLEPIGLFPGQSDPGAPLPEREIAPEGESALLFEAVKGSEGSFAEVFWVLELSRA
jgi:hypothetical protein